MTILLLALFAAAACLAIGSLTFTIRNYAQAALAIGRQLEACAKPHPAGQAKSRSLRQRKTQQARRAAKRRGASARSMRHDFIASAQPISAVHKIARRRQFGQSLLSPGTLVFE